QVTPTAGWLNSRSDAVKVPFSVPAYSDNQHNSLTRRTQMNKRRAMLGSLIALLLAAAPAVNAADKITLMVGGYEKIIYLPAKLAERLGYFKDEGLDVTLLNESAGVDAENELLAGAVQGVVGFYDHCVDLQTKGKLIESVV